MFAVDIFPDLQTNNVELAQWLSTGRQNIYTSKEEIFQLRTHQNSPISRTTNVLMHTDAFRFFIELSFDHALTIIGQDQDIDLAFVDADAAPLSYITMLITQMREIRPKLPVVVFTTNVDDRMRYLMREGASWHFTKQSRVIAQLGKQIQHHD